MKRSLLILLSLTSSLTAAPAPAPDNKATEEALRQAVEAVAKMEGDGRSQARIWCDVITLRHKLGDRRGAMAALQEIRKIIEKSEKPTTDIWQTLSTTLGLLGESKAALELAAAIPAGEPGNDDFPRQKVLHEAATSAAANGQFKTAGEIADAITDEAARKRTRELVSRPQDVSPLEKADSEEAVRDIWDSLTASEKVSMLVGWPMAWIGYDDTVLPAGGIAIALLNAKDKAGAKRVSLKALALLPEAEPGRRATAALAVVHMLCQLGEVADARKALALIPADDPKAPEKGESNKVRVLFALAHIAAAEVRASRDEAAMALLKNCERKGDEGFVLQFIALAQARAGRKEASKASFAKALEYHVADPEGLCVPHQLAFAQALSGDIAGAIRAAKQLKCDSRVWERIISFQIDAEDFNGARQTANDHLDEAGSPPRLGAMRTLAIRQSKAGQGAEVRAWAGKLENNLERAHAFLGLAEGLWQEPAKPGGK